MMALSRLSCMNFRSSASLTSANSPFQYLDRFPLREQVENSNRQRLNDLPGETYVYNSIDDGEEPYDRLQKTLDNVMAPRVLTLKVNAQVMLLKNMDVGLVNGSVGKIIAFKSLDEPLDDDEEVSREHEEFNIKVAQMKKEQGNEKEPLVQKKNPPASEKVPIVQWKMPDGSAFVMRMAREEFKVDDVGDKIKARRKQVIYSLLRLGKLMFFC